jgi:hypothetical protein
MITIANNKQLSCTYFQIALDACRRGQYERAEMLLPDVISETIDSKILDLRLISIIYDMAQFYILEGNKKQAIGLYKLLIHLKQTVSCLDCGDDYQFEEMVINQLTKQKDRTRHNLSQNPSKGQRLVKWLLSNFSFGKKIPAC